MGERNRNPEARRYAQSAADAEFERAVGPLRDFGFYVNGCASCGHTQRQLQICLGKDLLDPSRENQCPQVGQHLHAKCAACGDVWLERCKSDPENAVAPEGRLANAQAALAAALEAIDEALALPIERVKFFTENPRPIFASEADGVVTVSLK